MLLNKHLLETLFPIPSQYRCEADYMVPFLADYAKSLGCTVELDEYRESTPDEYGRKHYNVFITKGTIYPGEAFPCVASHIDNVQSMDNRRIIVDGDYMIAREQHTDRQCGFGADCKTGIYTCLELLRNQSRLKVAFFSEEEIGGIGARKCNLDFFKDVGYVIEFDCPSSNLLSYTSNGVQLFDNGGPFLQAMLPVLDEHQVKWQEHPHTDIWIVRERTMLDCVNLASGYYRFHAPDEFVYLPEMAHAVHMGAQLLYALGCRKYPFLNSSARPLRPVTGLRLPNRLLPEHLRPSLLAAH